MEKYAYFDLPRTLFVLSLSDVLSRRY